MKNLLYVSASVRTLHEGQVEHLSISRQLGECFIREFRENYSQVEVIRRDLAQSPPSYIDQRFVAASFATGELNREQRDILNESNQLIAEVERADIIVIASPMYNYGMPATLKAWFDQIIRVGRTFSFDLARGDNPLEPILSGKDVVLLASWGEFHFKKGEAKYAFNHLSSHIEQLSPYLGAEAFYEVAAEYQEFGDQRHQESKSKAMEEARVLAGKLAQL